MEGRLRSWSIIATILAAFVIVGCNSGSRDRSGGTTTPPTTPPPAATPTLTYAVGAVQTNQVSAVVPAGGQVLGLRFTLTAANGAVQVTSLTVTATGTVDETTYGQVRLIEDDNNNSQVDGTDTTRDTQNAMTTNNGTVTFQPTGGLTINPGTPRSFFVTIDGSGVTASTAYVGSNVDFQIAAATGIAATASGSAITPGGNFGTAFGPVTVGVHDHLLISEVVDRPGTGATAAEFVEIYNPTGETFQLDNYHLTDVSDTGAGTGDDFDYWQLTTASTAPNKAFAPLNTSSSTDWHARFPAGTTIAPGQAIVVALDGGGFNAAGYTIPTGTTILVLRNAQTGQTQMLTWDGPAGTFNFSATALTNNPGLRNGSATGGEPITLYFYNGQANPIPDLVTDIDTVYYGALQAQNNPNEKTTADVVDGFDNGAVNGTDTTPYNNDTTIANQRLAPTPTNTNPSVARTNFVENGESGTGGNGFGGDDETSEPNDNNWAIGTPTPGSVP